ncbi:MAG: CYTH domain-containing protein [Treponema sp.]|nr:CYTH domain-containing protein [Treponema sp.]
MRKNKEIELKIPLSDGEYDELKKRYFSGAEKVIKKDEYFSRYDTLEERIKNNEPKVIRIRTEGEEAYFTIKRKSIKNGIEVNEEKETLITNPEVLYDFLGLSGYHRWFYKEKKAYGTFYETKEYPGLKFHMELVTVNGMKYLEVEVTDTLDYTEAEVTKALEEVIKEVGLDPVKKDERSWYELVTLSK